MEQERRKGNAMFISRKYSKPILSKSTRVNKGKSKLTEKKLEKHFNSPSQRLQAKHLLGERYQRHNKTLAEFYEGICKLVQRAWSNKSIEFQNEKSLEYCVKGYYHQKDILG